MATSVKLSEVIPSRFAHLTPPSEENIERIRADLTEGSKILLNNPHVFKNEAGKWEILAGHDRAEAARRAGWDVLPVRDFTGTLNTDDAILAHFCRENLLRKEVSKATVAGEWLGRHPDWSDGKIAAESGCTAEHVGETRAVLVASGNIQLVSSRIGLDGRTRESKRAPRQPRGKSEAAPKKPAHESPEDVAAQITRSAAEKAKRPEVERTNPAPEPSPTEDDDGSLPESGTEGSGASPEHQNSEADVQEIGSPRSRVAVPTGKTLEAMIREGMELEAGGATAGEAAEMMGVHHQVYRQARYIVLLADRDDLTADDGALAKDAIDVLNRSKQVMPAFRVVESLVAKVFGDPSSRHGMKPERAATARAAAFDRAYGALVQACSMAPEIDVPYLAPARRSEIAQELESAIKSVRALRDRILKEMAA